MANSEEKGKLCLDLAVLNVNFSLRPPAHYPDLSLSMLYYVSAPRRDSFTYLVYA